jgi:ornithine carbamoyltransferase
VGGILDGLKGRDLTAITDFTPDESVAVLELAAKMKRDRPQGILAGKTLVTLFEKPSLRTRVTFDVAMTQLGGHAIYMQPAEIQLGVRERIEDVARCLSRWVDGITARTFVHDTVTRLAEHASVPVINALSDFEHPCQAYADYQTIIERKGDPKRLRVCYVGDGNNVCHSLMLLAAQVGSEFVAACPDGYHPDPSVLASAQEIAMGTGGSVAVETAPRIGAKGADVLYTDVWTSMGQEAETERRRSVFRDYQINSDLLQYAKPDAIVLHCLPAHRGEEITDEVMEGGQSAIFDQAENRLHSEKAILAALL